MELKDFRYLDNYHFLLTFANGKSGEVDLQDLVGKYVSPGELDSAQLNEEWGCLEFKNHTVDIEPKTLYRYFKERQVKMAS